jgi:hypothetical protein
MNVRWYHYDLVPHSFLSLHINRSHSTVTLYQWQTLHIQTDPTLQWYKPDMSDEIFPHPFTPQVEYIEIRKRYHSKANCTDYGRGNVLINSSQFNPQIFLCFLQRYFKFIWWKEVKVTYAFPESRFYSLLHFVVSFTKYFLFCFTVATKCFSLVQNCCRLVPWHFC